MQAEGSGWLTCKQVMPIFSTSLCNCISLQCSQSNLAKHSLDQSFAASMCFSETRRRINKVISVEKKYSIV